MESRQDGRRRGLVGLALAAWLVAVGSGHHGWADEASVEDRSVSEAHEPPFGRLERAFDLRLRKNRHSEPVRDLSGYVSLIDRNFNRAEEDAWLIGLAYDFGGLRVSGLSAFFNFAQGTGARDPAPGEARSNEREFDVTVDYRLTTKGCLEGLWFRLRGAIVQDGGRTTEKEIRLILNYEFPLL